jgi:hypothetical protein
MRKNLMLIAVGVILLAIVVGGCGGDDDKESGSKAPAPGAAEETGPGGSDRDVRDDPSPATYRRTRPRS